jgi:cupin domain
MRRSAVVLVSLMVTAVAIGVSLATGAGGLVQLVAFGAQDVYLDANGIGGVNLQTSGPTDVVTQKVTYHPGATSGWHYHPGVVLVTVTSGTATLYQADCTSKRFSARQAFAESGSHPSLVRNQSHADVVVYETYVVPHGSALQIDQPNPGCPVN